MVVGIASMVLGIVSLVFSLSGGSWISAIIGIVGIVLGGVGMKKKAPCSVAGLVLSIIGTALSLLLFIACMACMSMLIGTAGVALY